MYHGNANERQIEELHVVKKIEGTEKCQPTGSEPANSRYYRKETFVAKLIHERSKWKFTSQGQG